MPKALDAYTREFDEIKTEFNQGLSDLQRHYQFMGNTSGLIEAGEREIALRVGALKKQGVQGDTLDDFMADSEVKTSVASLNQHLDTLVKHAADMTSKRRGPFAMITARYRALRKDIVEDVASRKGSLSSLAGTGNSSLPQLKQLLEDIKAFGDDPAFDRFNQAETAVDHRQVSRTRLARLIANTDEAESEAEEETDFQALNIRNLTAAHRKAVTLGRKVTDESNKGKQAMAQRKTSELAAAKANANKAVAELKKLAAPYERVQRDQFVMNQVNDSSDKDKILKMLKELGAMKTKAEAEAKTLGH
jgi:hypothetical protein